MRKKQTRVAIWRAWICLGLVCFVHGSKGQKILLRKWHDASLSDSVRIEAVNNFIEAGFMYNNPDSANVIATELLNFAQSRQNLYGVAVAQSLLGSISIVQGNYSDAMQDLIEASEGFAAMGNLKKNSIARNNIGVIYLHLGNYNKALEYLQESLKISEQLHDDMGAASALGTIGVIYHKEKLYDRALEYYQRSLKIAQEHHNEAEIGGQLMNIGIVHADLGEQEKAIEYYQKSLKIFEQINDQTRIAGLMNDIGLSLGKMRQYKEAASMIQQSIAKKDTLHDEIGSANSLLNLGQIYLDAGEYNLALNCCQTGYDRLKNTDALSYRLSACECLYKVHKAKGNMDEALGYLEETKELNDSLNAAGTLQKLEQLEFSRRIEQDSLSSASEKKTLEYKHQQEIHRKNMERNYLMIGVFMALAGSGILIQRLRFMRRSRKMIEEERNRSDHLLLNILPREIADELKSKGRAEARYFEQVTVLFTDFVRFTEVSSNLSANELVSEIHTCFEAFDNIMNKYKLEKIKTIGDSYMAGGGLPIPSEDAVLNTVLAALEMQEFIAKRSQQRNSLNLVAFEMRVGIHTGSVVAGIVGKSKFQYDIWGDTVNTASRMESAGVTGRVNISRATYDLICNDRRLRFEARGSIMVKGKGEQEMWFVEKI